MAPRKKFTDNDGFVFKFRADTPAKERKYYYEAYKDNVNKKMELQRCMCCDTFISIHRIQMHPLLHITLCINCHKFYSSVDFNSARSPCRWCGKGGLRNTRRSCSKCEKPFCIKCILRVVPVGEEVGDDWNCFCCNPEVLYELKAQHWAIVNYAAKQKALNEKN